MSGFGDLLRRYRMAAGLSREQLAELSTVSARAMADLETGKTKKPHSTTVSLLADALHLTGAAREGFKEAAREAAAAAAGEWASPAAPPRDSDPQDWFAFIVAALDRRGVAGARMALTEWQESGEADAARLAWAERLLTLTAEGRLPLAASRPLPVGDPGLGADRHPFLGRQQEASKLGGFLDRVQQGRGGVSLVFGPSGIGKSLLVSRVLAERFDGVQADWITFDRGEAGYLGWRRLLAPLWTAIRRTELAPADVLRYAPVLDEILLVGSESELAGRHPPGDVARAIAAMLANRARQKALILVMDDAHRGGITSDQLLLRVARQINACRAGFIAALRPDELDQDSPLLSYSDQPDSRTAADVVTPIRVAPLNVSDTAELLSTRIRITPPPEVAEQVARQTDGRPQLIDNIELQAPADATSGSWVIRLGAEGLRVLLDTINSRPEPVRAILQAAAVCADGRCADPRRVAQVTGQAAELVEQALDAERRRGHILARHNSRYCFQHDNWIDELLNSCPSPTLSALHARCLASLRAAPSADPRKLIRHAIGAGTAANLTDEDMAILASRAAELHAADYAFSAAAQMYELAAVHSTGPGRADLMVRQADALRFCGRWREARSVLQQAARHARQLAMPDREAIALVHLERLTWTYGLDEQELTQQFREVMPRLPASETVLLAQARAGLASRLSIVARQYEGEQADLARAALQELPSVTDPIAAVDILVGSRCALQDIVSPEVLLGYDSQVLELAMPAHAVFHVGEALAARIVDLLRAARLKELPSALRAFRDYAERSAAPTASYTQALIDAMLALAQGEFDAASDYIAQAGVHSRHWGSSMANEALTAQLGWLLYEKGEVEGLASLVADLQRHAVSGLNEEVWTLGTGLIHAENGDAEPAIDLLRDVCLATGDLKRLPRGPARIGILATAAMVLGHPVVSDVMPSDRAHRIGTSIADLLDDHPDTFVIAGWPAVLLGSKHRYIGLARLAAGQPETAADHLARAAGEDGDFRVLHTRTRFDLARALIQQPDRCPEGLSEMNRVHQKAEELRMRSLAKQAADAQAHRPH
ncbi:MAG TPA: AAA family ATPase [Streptosporangiaceae bacterium]|nr:AAA family ATPase [Streptosporangiaceae bacterium]